ncbi:hypothetical protein G6F53_014106 [Rhizopus delemar]|nr:hypothetical protein G6F53_014106 [Rhizopus delemar]
MPQSSSSRDRASRSISSADQHLAGTHLQRGAARQQHRARHARAAAHDADGAEAALVGVRAAGGEQRGQAGAVDGGAGGRGGGVHGARLLRAVGGWTPMYPL